MTTIQKFHCTFLSLKVMNACSFLAILFLQHDVVNLQYPMTALMHDKSTGLENTVMQV